MRASTNSILRTHLCSVVVVARVVAARVGCAAGYDFDPRSPRRWRALASGRGQRLRLAGEDQRLFVKLALHLQHPQAEVLCAGPTKNGGVSTAPVDHTLGGARLGRHHFNVGGACGHGFNVHGLPAFATDALLQLLVRLGQLRQERRGAGQH